MSHFDLDASYRRPARGKVVIGGSPLRLFRLTEAGMRIAEALESGHALPPAHDRLTDRLLAGGVIHPRSSAAVAYSMADVTVMTPVLGAGPSPPIAGVTLVDDGNEPPLAGNGVLRRATTGGPAAARNTGLTAVTTALVAFVDADVMLDIDDPFDWIASLLGFFDDPSVALVAPRVQSAGSTTVIERYERDHSPLDLGPARARIAAGSRVSYVPAAAIVCRVSALRSVGGFDESLRYGEDVDLVWRLIDAGFACRYEPAAEVWHRPRSTLHAMIAQRQSYGSAAAPLTARHGKAVAPLRISAWSVAVWGLVAMRRPFSGAALAVGTTVALRRKLPDLSAGEVARLGLLGNWGAGRQIASAIRRSWWPLAVAAGLVSKRTRPAIVAALLAPLVQRPGATLDPLRSAALNVVDDIAYGAGVWQGAIRQRSAAALRPDLRNWPGRSAG